MSIKTILVSVSSAETGRATLETAAKLAKPFGAHLEVLHVRPDPKMLVPYTGEGMDGSMIEEIMEVTEREGAERAEKARAMFDSFVAAGGYKLQQAATADAGVTLHWREAIGREDEIVALRGRIFDIVVVGRPLKDSALPSPVTMEAALMDTGRPMLLAPPDVGAHVGRSIAVAWEGSTEAARAVAAALPLLRLAEKVTIITATAGSAVALSPEALAEGLAWHGIDAVPHLFNPGNVEIGAALLAEAAKVGADMMVKGAYSHSRLRQMILGGRTRHILFNTSMPVLLAH